MQPALSFLTVLVFFVFLQSFHCATATCREFEILVGFFIAVQAFQQPFTDHLTSATSRRENDYLRQQRDILKKTLGILSETPSNGISGLMR